MNMILTLDALLDTFEKYNVALWPMQVFAYILGIVALFFVFRQTPYSNRVITGILALMWLWTAIGFFMLYFGPVYTPAYVFGILFFIQGSLFLAATLKPRLSFTYQVDYSMVAFIFIAYAAIGYPVFGYFLGHLYPQSPPFGLTPCPTTIFTFGLYLLTENKVPKLFLVIPFLWAVGGIMPVSVGILEDVGLIISGVVGTGLILYRDRKLLE